MNWRIQKLQEDREKVVLDSDGILDDIQRQAREPTATETVRLATNRDKIDAINARIKKEEDHPANQPPTGKLMDLAWDAPAASGNVFDAAATTIGRHGKIGARYKDLFGASLSRDGWSSQQDFLAQIHSGMAHPGLNCMVEGTGSGGGFLVPTEYAAEMLDSAIETSIVASRARIYPMGSDTKKIAGFDASTDTATTLYGGLQAQWLGESESATATNPKVRKIELKAKKLALFTSSSNEVAEDGMGLDAQLSEAMTVGTGWFLDYAFLRGTGVGQPLGALNDPALVTVSAEDGQDPDTLVYENMIKMLSRIHAGCFNNSVWVCNPSCIPQLLSLYTPTGLGGAPVNVLRESNGGWSLLTRPLLMTEKLPPIGDKGDIILADFSQYAIGVRKEMTIEKSGHVYFMSDETAWRAISRVDGQGRWNKAFTPANGSTQSWCVALAAR